MSLTLPERELEKIESAQNINDAIEQLPLMFESISAQVKLMKKYYEELIENNFTKEQALKIIIAHGCFPPLNGIK